MGRVTRWVGFVLFCLLAATCLAEKNLRIVVWEGDEGLPVLRAVIRDFEKAHPGIKVKLENVAYDQYFQKLLAQYAANVAPDVAMMGPGNFQSFAKRNTLVPLNQFYGDIPGFKIDAYYKEIVDAHSWKDQLYVLPRDIAPMGLIYYNKKAFDEAGIPYPDGSWTWDFKVRPELKEKDFLWVMQQLTKKDKKGKTVRYGFTPFTGGSFAEILNYSQGLSYADDPINPRKVLYDDPRVIKTFQFVADLCLKDKYMPSQNELTSVLQSTAVQLFISQRSAMYQCGIWDSAQVRRANKVGTPDFFEWDIALAPAYKDGTRSMPTGGAGYCMMASTKYPKEAWLLIEWMAGKPGMKALAEAGIAQPAIHDLAVSDMWVPGPNSPPDQQYPPSMILTDEAVKYTNFGQTADYWPEVMNFVNSKIDVIWVGSMSAEQALKEGTRDGQRRLDAILAQESLPKFNWAAGWLVAGGLFLGLLGWVYFPERRRKLTGREKSEERAGYLFLSPWIIGMLVFTLGPMLLSLQMSTADWDVVGAAKWRGVGNFSEAFTQDSKFWKVVMVTAIYTIVSVPLGLIVSLALALLLNTKVKGISIYRTCFYIPALASAVAGSLIWRKIFQQDGGLLNSVIYGADGEGNLLGLGNLLHWITGHPGPPNWLGSETLALPSFILMAMWGVGSGMVIILAGLQGVPASYLEAATLDGANHWQRFRAVIWPLITPALFFVSITNVIGSFQVFTQAFVITKGGPNDATRFYMLHLYEEAFKNLRMGYASALAWILLAIILVFTMLQFRLNRRVHYEADLR